MKSKDVWFEGRMNRREYLVRWIVCLGLILCVLGAALCGWAIVARRTRENAAKILIPQSEVDGMLADLARGNMIEDYDQFNHRMDGHRLKLTNLTVRTTYGKGLGWKEVSCKTDDGVNVLLYVSAKMMESLSGDFIHDDRIARVEGRVLAALDSLALTGGRRPSYGNAIWMEVDQIDASWEDDQRLVNPTLSGDELARLLAGLQEKTRRRKCARLCRPFIGRELEFSECRVDDLRLDAKIPCVTMVALDPEYHRDGIKFSVPIDAVKGSSCELRELHVGQKLRTVRAVVCKKGDEGEALERLTAGVWMHLLKFETDEPTVALPPFDGTVITGDELVVLLRAHKNRLSPIQIDELQRKLSGRCLTFTGMRLRSYSGGNGEINSADFAFSDIGLQLSAELKPIAQNTFNSLKIKMLTGTVSEKSANDSYGDRALRLTDGVVE